MDKHLTVFWTHYLQLSLLLLLWAGLSLFPDRSPAKTPLSNAPQELIKFPQ